MFKAYIDSPVGVLEVVCSAKGLTNINFVKKKKVPSYNKVLLKCESQLKDYFSGKRKSFDLPLDLSGSTFEKKVWGELKRIPYGKTKSYKEISVSINNNYASRAVGNANKKNCIPIIIPCHRVIKSNGDIGGYSAGLWRKKWLLEHEARHKSL